MQLLFGYYTLTIPTILGMEYGPMKLGTITVIICGTLLHVWEWGLICNYLKKLISLKEY